MSRANMDAAERLHEAFNRMLTYGTEELFALLDPQIEWIPLTAALEGASYHGKDAIRVWIAEMQREWDFYETRPQEFRELDDERILVLGTWRARGRGSGVELDSQKAAWLFDFKAGKLKRMQTFTDRTSALEAAGLGE